MLANAPMGMPVSEAQKGPGILPAVLMWLPLPLLFGATIVLWIAGPAQSYEHRYMLLLLNIACSLLASTLVIVLMARVFLLSGKAELLLIGCGLLAWAFSGVVGALAGLIGRGGSNFENITITVHNLSVLLSGICHLAGSVIALLPGIHIRRKWLWLAASHAAVLGFIGMIIVAATSGWTPTFFIQDVGGTVIRQVAVFSSVLLFAIAAALIGRNCWNRPFEFGSWYAAALGLIAIGLLGVALQKVMGGALSWVGRSAQYLSGIYFIIAGIVSVRMAGAWHGSLDLNPWDRRATIWDDRLLRFLSPQYLRSLPAAWRYGLTAIIITLSTALRWALVPWMGTTAPYDISVIATLLTVVLLGIGPGLLTVISGDIAIELLVLGSFSTVMDGSVLLRLASSITLGVLLCIVFHSVRVALTRSRRSEARLSAFAAATFEGIVESESGRIVDCNEQLARILGYAIDELKGREIADMIAPEDRKRAMGNISENFDSVIEHTSLRKDGTRIIVEARGRSFASTHSRRYTAVRDISERKQFEEALRESAARLKLAQDSAGAGIWDWDIPADKLHWSDELFFLFGLDPRSVDANFDTWRRSMHPEDRPLAEKKIETAISRHTALKSEYRVVLPLGKIRWIRVLGDTIYDDGGAPQRMSGICIDVTDLKEAEIALRESEARRKVGEAVEGERKRFLDVLEALPPMICLLTRDHHIAFANRSFRERFGESDDRRCYECCFGRTEPCEFCGTFKVFDTGQPHDWELTTQDGSVVEVHAFPFTDASGTEMILEMKVDITERRRAEQELHKAHENLAARAGQLRALAGELTLTEQRERRRMARMLHDHLQQLLVGAKFRVAILGRAGDEIVRKGAREVEELIDECIAASRSLIAELSPPILHEAGLNAGLEWLARWMADKHGLFVELSTEDTPALLSEDVRLLLFESVRELLFNAVKHSQTRSAAVSVRYVDGLVQVVVSDRGVGFDPDAIPPAGERGGGYGLFSIRERLDLIGGNLQISSSPGNGSRFVMVAPADQPQARDVEPLTSAQGAQRRYPFSDQKIRVLLADDHVVMREGLARLLGQEPDMQIVGEAANGQDVVSMAGSLMPDVILMDMSMPILNGIQATRAIHSEYPSVKIIGLSMFEEIEQAQAMRDAGAAAYVTKSGDFRNLVLSIRNLAAQKRRGG